MYRFSQEDGTSCRASYTPARHRARFGPTSGPRTAVLLAFLTVLLALVTVARPADAQTYAYQRTIGGPGPFDTPLDVAVDSGGSVYVADIGKQNVQKYNSQGNLLQTVITANSGGVGQYFFPASIAVAPGGALYVADGNNVYNTSAAVRVYSASGVFQFQFGLPGSGNGQISGPGALAFDPSGNVYVVDNGNLRIEKFTAAGAYIGQFSTTANVNYVQDIAVDSSGNICVLDGNDSSVKKFSSTGSYLGVLVAPNKMFGAKGLAFEAGGTLLAGDATDRITRFDANGVLLGRFGGRGGGEGTGNGRLNGPEGLTTDSAGNIYVADSYNKRVQKFSAAGAFLGKIAPGAGQFTSPRKVVVDASGNTFVTDQYAHCVYKFDAQGQFLLTIGSYGSATGQFINPDDVTLDSGGNLYVSDGGNRRIQKFDGQGSFLLQFDSVGYPTAVTVGSTGAIWVASYNVIRKFDAQANLLSQFTTNINNIIGLAVDAQGRVYAGGDSAVERFNTDGTLSLNFGTPGSGDGQFNFVTGIALDGVGNVFVAESNNQRIQKFDTNGAFVTKIRAYGFNNDQFLSPSGVGVDNAGAVYIVDDSNTRVQVWVAPTTNAEPTLSGLSPSQAAVGSGPLTLTVTGEDFVASSKVFFGNTQLVTTFVSANQLTAQVPATLLASAGTVPITVQTPAPGGGTSNEIDFEIIAPAAPPTLTGVSPAQAALGSGNVTITLTGSGFTPDTKARFDGTELATSVTSATSATATIPASLLTTLGTFPVTAVNTGGASASVSFVVVNPTPVIQGVTPSQLTAGSGATLVTLIGTGFLPTSQVQVDGQNVATTYVNATKLTVTIPAGSLANPGTVSLTVVNPAPGGGTSNTKTITVVPATTTLAVVSLPAPTVTRSNNVLTTTITIKNIGANTAYNVSITSAKMGTIAASSGAPATLGTIAPGATATFTVSFPGSAAAASSKPFVNLTYSSLNAGTGSFSVRTAAVP